MSTAVLNIVELQRPRTPEQAGREMEGETPGADAAN